MPLSQRMRSKQYVFNITTINFNLLHVKITKLRFIIII